MNIFTTYKQLLTEFVALQSVSTDSDYLPEITKTVEWLTALFQAHQFEVTTLTSPKCNPVVVARYQVESRPTTLIYGHYDVQPASLNQGWSNDPFTLTEANGRLLGRGVVDNKGQVLAHMVAIFDLIAQGQLQRNITFLIEGNEETANPALAGLIADNQKLLACDEIIVSDGEILGDRPTLEASLRGGFNMRVQVRTATTDLHSGITGGAVPNAAKVLSDLLAGLTDAKGGVTLPAFYADMKPIPPEAELENRNLAAVVNPTTQYGVQQFLSANNTDLYTQTGLYPSIEISGLRSGYTGEGYANIVPAAAEARLNVRTVGGQQGKKIIALLRDYFTETAPNYAEISTEIESPHEAVELDVTSPRAQAARKLLAKAYGAQPLLKYVGGSIPIVADFEQILGISPLLISLGNDDCNMHGADENFRVDLAKKALAFSQLWFSAE